MEQQQTINVSDISDTQTEDLETCESAVCVRIESRIESGVKIRIRIESANRIFSTPGFIKY